MTTALSLLISEVIRVVDAVEWACVLFVAFKMTERVERPICITFGLKGWTLFYRNCWGDSEAFGNDAMQLCHDNRPARASRLAQGLSKSQITQVTQPPYSPDLGPCNSWLFSKLFSNHLWKGRDFRLLMRFRKIRADDSDGENCVRSQGAYFQETEASSYVQHFLYLL